MPTTVADLDHWEKTRDVDKFVQILRYLSGDKYLSLRLRAIEVLGYEYDAKVVPLLLSEMGFSPDTRSKAAQVLVSWGKCAAESVYDYLQGSRLPIQVAQEAFSVIGEFDPEIAYNIYLKLLLDRRGIAITCANICKIGLTSRFHALVNDPDPFKRWAGLEVIRNSLLTAPACKLLCATTRDIDVQIRSACYAILEYFISMEDPDQLEEFTCEDLKEIATEPARKGLDDPEAHVRMDALSIIGEIRDEASLERVIELSRDEYRGVRKQALFTLGCFQHSGTKLMLLRAYLDLENDDRHHQYAVRALGTCSDAGCFDILRGIMAGETSLSMLARVTEALLEIDAQEAINLLVTEIATKEELRAAIRRYVGRVPQKVHGLAGMLKREKKGKRLEALIWLFGELGGIESILPLCELVDEADDYLELITHGVRLILDDAQITIEEFIKEVSPQIGPGFQKVCREILRQKETEEEDGRDILLGAQGLI